MYKFYSIAFVFLVSHYITIGQTAWELKLDKEGIQVYTKKQDSSSLKAVKAISTIQAPMESLTAVLLDIENTKDWMYATKTITLLKQLSPTEVIYYSEIRLPWPISNRDYIAHLTILQDPQTNVVTATCTNNPDWLPRNKNIVRVEKSWSQWRITPLPNGQLNVEYELQVDPGGNIPIWLVNLYATTGPFYTFRKLREQVQKDEYKDINLAFIKE